MPEVLLSARDLTKRFGGFTAVDVPWALANATTGEFAAPLISVHGDADSDGGAAD